MSASVDKVRFVADVSTARTTEWTTRPTTDLVSRSLSSYQRLGGVHFIKAIPPLPSGTVLRRELRATQTQSTQSHASLTASIS